MTTLKRAWFYFNIVIVSDRCIMRKTHIDRDLLILASVQNTVNIDIFSQTVEL